MRTTLSKLATGSVLAATIALVPQIASAQKAVTPGRWFAGVDAGVMQPLNAMNRYVATGGVIAPFFGYKFYQDRDKRFNLGLMAQAQVIYGPEDRCTGCVRGVGDDDTVAIGYHAGPRISFPYGPFEAYGTWQGGGLSGLQSPSAITDTSWGMSTGGGLNYSLSDQLMLGIFARWNRFYQRVHGVGDVRYITAGLGVTWQQAPLAPPPPAPAAPAAAPPPPPPPPTKRKIILRGVNFDFDKSNIRPDAVPILEQACETLKEESTINVSADGYTDSIGTEQYNLGLSRRRANAVREWLIKCGIPASRITTRGFGESNPVASNATPEGRAQNRRTELVVTNQ
ncbi:MAG: OmpA family protein [Candidatus Binatia bacterium]